MDVEFEQFYASCAARTLRGLTLTVGNAEVASDAFQEAMARAWLRWDRLQGYGNPAGWVYVVALNEARSALRRGRRQVPVAASGGEAHAPWQDDRRDEGAVRFRELLASLSWDHRAVLVLRFYFGYTAPEVTAILGIPEGTVRSRQHWALRHLRASLEGDDGYRAMDH